VPDEVQTTIGASAGDEPTTRSAASARATECFVVMPFGKKPVPAAPESMFDFDKPYRVIMRRAIEAAGMVPVRADESTASGIIHTDMFKALRDKRIVLAELSLHNPNVYYELGIRHVLSSAGTVLMCRTDQPLPFDIALSRVVMYEYDGRHLDWEEAERVIPILRQYLLEAQQGHQDSPVHALIHIPTSERHRDRADTAANPFLVPELHRYEKDLGERWRKDGADLAGLMTDHGHSIFGARAMGYYCLADDSLPEGSAAVADQLVDAAQYDLANELFERLGPNELDFRRRLTYASSYSEEHPDLAGADQALAMVEEVIADVQKRLATSRVQRTTELAYCFGRLGGLLQWRWQRSHEPRDLDAAIDSMRRSLELMLDARRLGAGPPAGLIAQTRVKVMLHLRIRDQDAHRPDAEQHGRAVLAITPDLSIDDPMALSWLRWYQVIVVADEGHERDAREKTYEALREDARLNEFEHREVGKRQYQLLRRFIDQYSEWFREPSLIGTVAQALQSRLEL
jgi:hypothetical protein